ncbi:MAG: type I restriction endonuclease subunit R [Oligosphaeraceae bacterium]
MNYQEQKEIEYQAQVLDIFKNKLHFHYLGNFKYDKGTTVNALGQKNSPFLEKRFRDFLKGRKNQSGKPFTEAQVAEACRQIRNVLPLPDSRPGSLVNQNTKVTEMMFYGVKAHPSPDTPQEDIPLFDFADPMKNDFAIAEEVSFTDPITGKNSRPDLVVYVNGFALAVIELKRSLVSLNEGIKQHLSNEGDLIPSFFTTVQFTIAASDKNGFLYGTIETPLNFWCPYKRSGDVNALGDKEAFATFFEKEHFLRMFRYGVITDGGIKKVMRPHQYHALCACIPRLEQKSSGIIWHSQGSGKSLTMIWLASYIRANFPDPRVLVITDRKELDIQIANNFKQTGQDLRRVDNGDELLKTLKGGTEWLISSLIHKFGRSVSSVGEEDSALKIPLDTYLEGLRTTILKKYGGNFKVRGSHIFVFVDECHRTQGGRLHEAMKEIMGQDVMLIGFTGTPLLKRDKENTYKAYSKTSVAKFGPFIHKYLHKEAVADKVINDLQYENRDVEQRISNKEQLDAKKEEITRGLDDQKRQQVEDRWATLERIFSSKERIERIGYSILDDMSKPPLSEGWCNAMLVAGNIESAYRYYDWFQNHCSDTTLKGRCAVVTSYEPKDDDLRKKISNPAQEEASKFKYQAAQQSFKDAGQPNAEKYEAWAKERFVHQPGQMKLMIVVDKLLTGFDAPCATYLYLDKDMRDNNLFQAICRVNRLGKDVKDKEGHILAITKKQYGVIVDFKDLFHKIQQAVADFNDSDGGLGGFDPEDIDGLLNDHVEKVKERFLAALDAYNSLKASWGGDRDMDALLEYYLTDFENDPAAERRQLLYAITRQFATAYSNFADYMGRAGDTTEQANQWHRLVSEATQVSLRVEQKSGDFFDEKEKDPEMRALLDRFIQADEAEVIIPATADFSFLDLLDDGADSDTTAEEAIKAAGDGKSAAEIVEGKARSVLNSYRHRDPATYLIFSQRLQALLEQIRQEKLDYAENIRRLIAFLKELKHSHDDIPPEIQKKYGKALWNNRGDWYVAEEGAESPQSVIMAMEEWIEYDAPAGFENPSSPKADKVKRRLQYILDHSHCLSDDERVSNVYMLIVQNR